MRVTINPQSGEEVQALMAKLYATPKEIVDVVRATIAREK
jgi:hypothetical protein